MDFFIAMDVAASGLLAERTRMEIASANIANASTTRTPEGGPYKRQSVVLEAKGVDAPAGEDDATFDVTVSQVLRDNGPPRVVHDPGHPDADAEGNVAYPNVNVVEEMVDMITASRAYEAGITALKNAVAMAESTLGIGR